MNTKKYLLTLLTILLVLLLAACGGSEVPPVAPQEAYLATQVTPQTLALALFVTLSGGLLQGFQSAKQAAALKPSQII